MASRLKVEKEAPQKHAKYINSDVDILSHEGLSSEDTESTITANASAKEASKNMETNIDEYKELLSKEASKISQLGLDFEDFDEQMAKINKGK